MSFSFPGNNPATTATGATPVIDEKTPYNVLPEEMKKNFKDFAKQTKEQREKLAEIRSHGIQAEVEAIQNQTNKLNSQVSTNSHVFKREAEKVDHAKAEVLEEKKWCEVANSNWFKVRNSRFADKDYSSKYFQKLSQKLELRMQELWRQIEDVSDTLSRNESKHATSGQMLLESLRTQQEAFLGLASQIAASHEQAEILREQYKKYFLPINAPDPFKEETPAQVKIQLSTAPLPGFQQVAQQQPQQQQQAQPAAQTSSFGFGFGAPAATTTSTTTNTSTGGGFGFDFGNTASAATTQPAATGTGSTSGFSFGFDTGSTGASSGGFNFGTPNAGTGSSSTGFKF